ncbi:MAG: hypothetical protein DRJ98_01165 [Thermoprotei archaeon]|nr:MAG: hypothetical protein DRJ98_01165 [Thermoprotei archaeon]
MRRLGKVQHASKLGSLIVKPSMLSTLPPLGSKVYNREGVEVGEVYDIIGSTKSPYIVIKTLPVKLPHNGELFVKETRGAKRPGGIKRGRRKH